MLAEHRVRSEWRPSATAASTASSTAGPVRGIRSAIGASHDVEDVRGPRERVEAHVVRVAPVPAMTGHEVLDLEAGCRG